MITRLCLCISLALPSLVWGQTPAETARAAIAEIEAASQNLAEARSGSKRVSALTGIVQGYERGLSALRDGMRQAAGREAQLIADLQAREQEVGALLGVLQSISRAPAPAGLIHPEGPAGTARAGMLLADVTPALQVEVTELRRQVQEIMDMQAIQSSAAETLEQGLKGAQEARTALSQAIADRLDLPKRFTEDPLQTAVMIAATETLEGFASALASIEDDPSVPSPASLDADRGNIPLPVTGRILRRAGESDAAGVTRPGVLIATGGQALVTTPVPATIRYVGPLLNFGLVTILEPEADTLFVFGGMAQVFGEAGQVLPPGDPVGLMGASQSGDGTGNTRPETLYIEVRQNGQPVDPAGWFRIPRE